MAKRQADLDRGVERMLALNDQGEIGFRVERGVTRPVWEPDAGTMALYERARVLAAEFGIELTHRSAGGGSDGNFTGALGIPTLDGLGLPLTHTAGRLVTLAGWTGTAIACTAGVGFEAEIAQRFNRLQRRGFLRYLTTSARAFRQWEPQRYVVSHEGKREEVVAFTLAVSNTDQYGNNARIAPGASGYGRGPGGCMADKRDPRRLRAPALVVAGIGTALTLPIVRYSGEALRGGAIFAIKQKLGLPVKYVGVGEKPEDLEPFDPDAFVTALFE